MGDAAFGQLDSSDFTQAQLFSALARDVEKNGKIVKNSAPKWSDIDPSLRSTPIEVMGPSPTSAAYYGFLKTIMDCGVCVLHGDCFAG